MGVAPGLPAMIPANGAGCHFLTTLTLTGAAVGDRRSLTSVLPAVPSV